jgi:hypothetical protein
MVKLSFSALFFVAALAGCNLIYGMDEGLPLENAGGGGGGGGGGGPGCGGAPPDTGWDCLDKVGLACSGVLTFPFKIENDPGTISPAVSIKVCQRTDDGCSTPTATFAPELPAGVFEVPVNYDFTGYLAFNTLIYKETLIELGPLTTLSRPQRPVFLATQADFNSALDTIMPTPPTPIDEVAGLGHLFVLLTDCAGAPVPGMQLSADEKDGATELLYAENGFPMFQFRTDMPATNASGLAGFVNLPVGPVTVRATRYSDTKPVGTATVLIKAGAITVLHLGPTPP